MLSFLNDFNSFANPSKPAAQTKFGRCKQQMTLYMFGQYHGVLPAIYNQLYGKYSVTVLTGLR